MKNKIAIFCEKYPHVGPIVWMSVVQFFITEWFVAGLWRAGEYSYATNTISDLGATACGEHMGRAVCSGAPAILNGSLMCLGVAMALGAFFIYQEFRESAGSHAGFSLMGLSGFGAFMIGMVPENVSSTEHLFLAFSAFFFGHVALLVLSYSLSWVRSAFRVYTAFTGLLGLCALTLFIFDTYLGLGIGGMERLVVYPLLVWLILFGVYISASHFRTQR